MDVQFSLRMDRKLAEKLDAFAAVVGVSRAALIRDLAENFAQRSDELVAVLSEAKKGAESEAVHAWASEVIERAEYDAQLTMPTTRRSTT